MPSGTPTLYAVRAYALRTHPTMTRHPGRPPLGCGQRPRCPHSYPRRPPAARLGWRPHIPYLAAPEVRVLGTIDPDEPTLLPAEHWNGTPAAQCSGNTPPLTLVAVRNAKGLQALDLPRLYLDLQPATRGIVYATNHGAGASWASSHVTRAVTNQEQRCQPRRRRADIHQ